MAGIGSSNVGAAVGAAVVLPRPRKNGPWVCREAENLGEMLENCTFSRFSRVFSPFLGCIFRKRVFNHLVRYTGRTILFTPETSHGGNRPMAKVAKKAPSKTEILTNVAAASGIAKKDVAKVLEALAAEIKKNLTARGPGMFAIPGLVKIERKKVPARAAQKGVPNPFKPGELMDRPAKPASVKVKVRALKSLKDMVK
jgi:hypothetical protein